MTTSEFINKANELLDVHNKLVQDIEAFRYELGKLETLALAKGHTTKASEILSLDHHFILNGVENQFNALREGIVRAMRAYNREQKGKR